MKNTGNPLVVTFKLVKLQQKSLFTSAKHKWLKAVLASDLDAGPWCFVCGKFTNYEIVSGFLRVLPIRPKGVT